MRSLRGSGYIVLQMTFWLLKQPLKGLAPDWVDEKEPDYTPCFCACPCHRHGQPKTETGTSGVKMLYTENREILAGLRSPRQDNPFDLCKGCPECSFYIQIAGLKQDRIIGFYQRGCGTVAVAFVALPNIG